jgi:hypothetical protein
MLAVINRCFDCRITWKSANPTQRLERILHIEATQKRLVRRVHDMKKNIEGARGEVNSLRSMADVVSEGKEFKVQEAVQNNTKNLEDVFRANERASASLEIMQIVLAGSLAFDIIDRLHGGAVYKLNPVDP